VERRNNSRRLRDADSASPRQLLRAGGVEVRETGILDEEGLGEVEDILTAKPSSQHQRK